MSFTINTAEMPLTASAIADHLTEAGVAQGATLLVHSSMKSMNRWIVGGEAAVIVGLETALGSEGTLVMPAHTSDLSEPSLWQHPPVPESWWSVIRSEMPPFKPDLTPTSGMGAVSECFRKQEGSMRSAHPQLSFAARGPYAGWITGNHSLEYGLGEVSPLARLYELDGWVLLLGVGHQRNTSLHLSEHRASYKGKTIGRQGAPVLVNGERQWVEYEEIGYDSGDFHHIGAALERDTNIVKTGKLGDADLRLMKVRELVDYGAW